MYCYTVFGVCLRTLAPVSFMVENFQPTGQISNGETRGLAVDDKRREK